MSVPKILREKSSDFRVTKPILEIELDASTIRMCIVETALVQVICKIELHRVPAAVFKVDQNDLCVVISPHKDVILLSVIVRQNYVVTVDQPFEVLLIAFKQEVTVYGINHLQEVWMRDPVVL